MWIVLASACLVAFYVAVRLRTELQMLQQNSYRPRRYWRWFLGSFRSDQARATDIATDCGMVGIVSGFADGRWGLYAIGAVGAICVLKALKLLRRRSKKPLVFTARAVRLYVVAVLLLAGLIGWAYVSEPTSHLSVAAGMLCAVFAPVILLAAWVLLWPVERLISGWYVRDARRILASMPSLVVVGITGSYGKTSTKHALARILGEKYSVVMTPGSFNTLLGVVRTVRENLKPYTRVFIVEMGAKSRGDIAEICRLVHPSIGILTSVGPQHLESFKTIDNVQRAKFELIDALPRDGVAVLNDDFEPIRTRAVDNVGTVLRYTSDEALAAGIETRLVGRHNISNVFAASLVARELGVTDEQIRYAVDQLEPVPHRLEVTRRGGLTIIDDAFNSNPSGAAMALEVLAGFSGGRRIVVTPGMIELGTRQEELNRELGKQIASACDFAVVVGEYNRNAIVAGLMDAGFPSDNIYNAADLDAAASWVRAFARSGDTILYENDLPDTFK